MHLHINRKNTAQHIYFIYRAYFSSLYKCFSSDLRSAAVIVIASAGYDGATDTGGTIFSTLFVTFVFGGVDATSFTDCSGY
jgi:hypothetical protein